MEQKIGLLVGREWSFPPAFIEEVNRRDTGVAASRHERRRAAQRRTESAAYDDSRRIDLPGLQSLETVDGQ